MRLPFTATRAPSCASSQASQCGHQLPGCSVADSTKASNDAARLSPVQYWYLPAAGGLTTPAIRSEEHTSELQSLMRISYAVFCLKKKRNTIYTNILTMTDYINKLISVNINFINSTMHV